MYAGTGNDFYNGQGLFIKCECVARPGSTIQEASLSILRDGNSTHITGCYYGSDNNEHSSNYLNIEFGNVTSLECNKRSGLMATAGTITPALDRAIINCKIKYHTRLSTDEIFSEVSNFPISDIKGRYC